METLGYLWVLLNMSNYNNLIKFSRMIKYEHSDAGLSYTNVKIKKLRTF